jgi:Protein of unknown function (DUF2950)
VTIMAHTHSSRRGAARSLIALALMCTALSVHSHILAAQRPAQRTFATPEDAVRGLIEAAKAGNLDDLRAIFGPDGQELIASSDAATARTNREIFAVAAAEGWRLVNQGTNRKGLIVGNEGWPFPVPLVKSAKSWRFDAAAGKEEVLARRIGRNELAVIGICRTYVAAQRRYAQQGHDGKPEGLFATTFGSDPGKQNGLYWPAAHGQPRSPLGDLVAQAAEEGRQRGSDRAQPTPFHGYYFKILSAQGSAAPGGAKSYVVNGEMSAGFALVAWPAQYDASGIMTFAVNQDGTVHQTDLGAETATAAAAMTAYNPDAAWRPVQ